MARSFEILIPVIVIVATLHPLNLLVASRTGMIIPEAIMHLLQPLVSASDTLPAVLLSVLICQILWFAGIHGALIVTGIMNPFWLTNGGEPGGAGGGADAAAHLSDGLLGLLFADWRRRLYLAAGVPAAEKPRRAPAHHWQNGHRAEFLQY